MTEKVVVPMCPFSMLIYLRLPDYIGPMYVDCYSLACPCCCDFATHLQAVDDDEIIVVASTEWPSLLIVNVSDVVAIATADTMAGSSSVPDTVPLRRSRPTSCGSWPLVKKPRRHYPDNDSTQGTGGCA
jgi:hypothetical protein